MEKTQGLMGSFDEDVSNDLTPKGGSTPLPLNSTIQTIHEKFGITCLSFLIFIPLHYSIIIFFQGSSVIHLTVSSHI